MNNDWSALIDEASKDSTLAQRLLESPEEVAQSRGIQLSAKEILLFKAFSEGMPTPEAIKELSSEDIELLMVPNH